MLSLGKRINAGTAWGKNEKTVNRIAPRSIFREEKYFASRKIGLGTRLGMSNHGPQKRGFYYRTSLTPIVYHVTFYSKIIGTYFLTWNVAQNFSCPFGSADKSRRTIYTYKIVLIVIIYEFAAAKTI